MDLGSKVTVKVRRFMYVSKIAWRNNKRMLLGAQFQGSNDKQNWITLATVDSTVKRGHNNIKTTVR